METRRLAIDVRMRALAAIVAVLASCAVAGCEGNPIDHVDVRHSIEAWNDARDSGAD